MSLNPYALPRAYEGRRSSALLAAAMGLVVHALPAPEAQQWLKEAAAFLWWMDRSVAGSELSRTFDPARVYGRCDLCGHRHGAEPCGEALGPGPPYNTCVCPLGGKP